MPDHPNKKGENGKVRYTIVSGDKRGDFSIDENTGVLRVNKQLDYERQNTYELTVQAEDSAPTNQVWPLTQLFFCSLFVKTH